MRVVGAFVVPLAPVAVPRTTKPAAKSAKKSAKAKPTLIPQPNGRGALLSGGVVGNKGGTGRPPNWLKDWCDDLLADPKCQAQVEAVLQDKDHTAFASMWRAVSERAKGKPGQSIELTGKDGGPVAVDRVLRWGSTEIPL